MNRKVKIIVINTEWLELKHPSTHLSMYSQCISYNFFTYTFKNWEKDCAKKIISEITDRWHYTTGHLLKRHKNAF